MFDGKEIEEEEDWRELRASLGATKPEKIREAKIIFIFNFESEDNFNSSNPLWFLNSSTSSEGGT
jgi:hypothetical protein